MESKMNLRNLRRSRRMTLADKPLPIPAASAGPDRPTIQNGKEPIVWITGFKRSEKRLERCDIASADHFQINWRGAEPGQAIATESLVQAKTICGAITTAFGEG